METYNDISDELSSMGSPLAGMSRNMPYRLPEGYFDGLATQVLIAITVPGEITALEGGTKKMPFDVPNGYFDQLQASVLQQVQQESIETGLPKANVFTAPEGYFDTLPGNIMAAIHASEAPQEKQRTRIIGIGWKSIRWAAAAVVIVGLGIGSVKMIWPGAESKESLAKIPATSIQAYVQQNIDEFDSELIENNIAANINLHTQPGLPNTIDKNDIIQYLDENGWEEPATTTN